ncbi:MAG: MraY family glycosyltransferase [Candidatus Moranbacteria bacterium]|nr:MraY family glycosyltransferase [Candidatus Moranbacteria bacterium]
MRFDLFLLPLLIAFSVTIGLCLLFLLVPMFQRQVWRHGKRHQGKHSLSRLGGVAMGIAFMGTVVFDPHLVMTREFFGLLIGGLLVCGFGLWDDFRELSFKAQAFFQVAVTIIIFTFGIRITAIKVPFGEVLLFSEQGMLLTLLSFLVLFGWMLLVMNAVNWMDGLDGLLGGVSFITFLTVFFLSLKPEVNQPPVAILAIIAAGLTAGFLFFNLHPAKILAGTTGSMFLGFLIAVLAIIAGTKVATALLVLTLPVADALWVIGERFVARVSIFQSDQRHLHYKLRKLGWKEGHIAWLFSILTGIIAVVALNTAVLGKFIAFLLSLTVIFSLLIFVAYRTKQKERLRASL